MTTSEDARFDEMYSPAAVHVLANHPSVVAAFEANLAIEGGRAKYGLPRQRLALSFVARVCRRRRRARLETQVTDILASASLTSAWGDLALAVAYETGSASAQHDFLKRMIPVAISTRRRMHRHMRQEYSTHNSQDDHAIALSDLTFVVTGLSANGMPRVGKAHIPLNGYCGEGKLETYVSSVIATEFLREYRPKREVHFSAFDAAPASDDGSKAHAQCVASNSQLSQKECAPDAAADRNHWLTIFISILKVIQFPHAERRALEDRYKSIRHKSPGISASARSHGFEAANQRMKHVVHRELDRRGLSSAWTELNNRDGPIWDAYIRAQHHLLRWLSLGAPSQGPETSYDGDSL